MARISFNECDGLRLKSFIIAGVRWLSHYRDHLDEINVFPVADADTGANMYMTLTSICSEVRKTSDPVSAGSVAKSAAIGALLGSKGNSGLILSQFFRGFSEYIADNDVIYSVDIAGALKRAADCAREGINNPKDGTILSVASDLADAAVKKATETNDIFTVLNTAYERAVVSLEKTRVILPEMSEAGVVDSGAKGLVLFIEGMIKTSRAETLKNCADSQLVDASDLYISDKKIDKRFCTTVVFDLFPESTIDQVKQLAQSFGESIVIDKGIDNISKIHLHVNEPDLFLEKLSAIATAIRINIEDMKKQIEDKR